MIIKRLTGPNVVHNARTDGLASGLVLALPLTTPGVARNLVNYPSEEINYGSAITWDYMPGLNTPCVKATTATDNTAVIWASLNSLSLTADFTISAWVNLDTGIDNNDAIARANGGGSSINFFGARVRYFAGGVDRVTAASTQVAGTTYHIVVTRLSTTHTIYINGVQDATAVSAVSGFIIRTIAHGGMKLANFLAYNRALNDGEVAQLYFDPWAPYGRIIRNFAIPSGAPVTTGYTQAVII